MLAYRDFLPSPRLEKAVAVSPDDSRVAYIDDAHGQFNITVQPLSGAGPSRLTSYVDSTVRRIAWHPNGTELIFAADTTGDERTQIYRVDLASKQATQLTKSPSAQFALALGDPVSPDGRWLAYSGNDRTTEDQDVIVQDLDTGQARRVFVQGGRIFAGHWSPDGSHLTVTKWRDANSDHVIYTVPASGEPASRLTPLDGRATYWLGPWLQDGSGFIVMSNVGREFAGLAIMNSSTGELTWLDAPSSDVENVALSRGGSLLTWTVNVDGVSELRARDLTDGSSITMPSLPAGRACALAMGSRSDTLAVVLDSATRPLNIALVDTQTGTIRWLTEFLSSAAATTKLVEPELIRYRSKDGESIPAYLYRPPTQVSQVACVLYIHGGPSYQERPIYNQIFQYLLSQGIAVLAPNGRGSTGYGISYKSRLHRDWGGVDLDDWTAAVEFVRTQDWSDAGRIAVLGSSYGGFGVLSCIARRPEMDWAAAVAICAPSNLVTFTRSQPPTWRSTVRTMIGDPDEDYEFLISRSPVTYADDIQAPLLVIQGANDPRVPRQESDQIVERLRSRGVDVRYDVYPDEGHGFLKRKNQISAHSSACEFLMSHLA